MWERLSHFRFDEFDIRKFFFSIFSRLKLVWKRLCPMILADRFWFDFRNPFFSYFSIISLACEVSVISDVSL